MSIINRRFYDESLDSILTEQINDNYVFIQKTYIKEEEILTNKTFEETVWYSSEDESNPLTYPYWNYGGAYFTNIYFKNEVLVNENWKNNETLFIWGSEILTMHMLPASGTKTYFLTPSERGLYGTSTKHEAGEIIREVIDISKLCLSINVNNQAISVSSDLYSPIVSNSYIEIQDTNFDAWSPFKNGFMDGNAIYIYETKNNYINHMTTLFLNRVDIKYDEDTISLELQNKYKFLIDKKMDKTGIIGNQKKVKLKDAFKQLIHQSTNSSFYFSDTGNRIRYSSSMNEAIDLDSQIPLISMFAYKEYTTYGDAIKALCTATGTRMFFNEREEIILDNDTITIDKDNIIPYTMNGDNYAIKYHSFIDYDNIENLSGNYEPAITINKIESEYKRRIPLFNSERFYTDEGFLSPVLIDLAHTNVFAFDTIATPLVANSPEYLKTSTMCTDVPIKMITTVDGKDGFNNTMYVIFTEDDFKNYIKVNYNDLVIATQYLQSSGDDDDFNLQFYGKIIDIKFKEGNVYVYIGFGADVNYQQYHSSLGGYIDYLSSVGFNTIKDFKLFFNIAELPIMYQYAKEINDTVKRDSIRHPLIPRIVGTDKISSDDILKLNEYSFYVKFAAPENSNFKYSGFVEDDSQFYTTYNQVTKQYEYKALDTLMSGISCGELSVIDENKQIQFIRRTILNSLEIEYCATLDTDYNEILYKYNYTYSGVNRTIIKVKIEPANDGENDLKISIKINVVINPGKYIPDIQILNMLSANMIEVTQSNFNSIYNSNVLLLQIPTSDNSEQSYYYTLYKLTKYSVIGKKVDNGKYYIIVDKNIPMIKNDLGEFFKLLCIRQIYHLNYLTLRANPIVEETETFKIENSKSIERFKENSISINASFITKDFLFKFSNCILNETSGINFSGYMTQDNIKYILTAELANKNYALDVLDKVLVTESDKFGLNNVPFIIIEKKIVESESESKEIYTLLNWIPEKMPNNFSFSNIEKSEFIPLNPYSITNYLSIDDIKDKKILWNEYEPNANGVLKYPYCQLKNVSIGSGILSAQLTNNTNPSGLQIKHIESGEKVLLKIANQYVTAQTKRQIGLTKEQAYNVWNGKSFDSVAYHTDDTVIFNIVDPDPLKTGNGWTVGDLPTNIANIELYVFYSNKSDYNVSIDDFYSIKQFGDSGILTDNIVFELRTDVCYYDLEGKIQTLNPSNFTGYKIYVEEANSTGKIEGITKDMTLVNADKLFPSTPILSLFGEDTLIPHGTDVVVINNSTATNKILYNKKYRFRYVIFTNVVANHAIVSKYYEFLMRNPIPPTSGTDIGEQGETRFDANYMYVCVSTNRWKKIPLSTW